MIDRTRGWYRDNRDGRGQIEENLVRLELDSAPATVDTVIDHVALHYYEKLLPLCTGAEKFRAFLDANVDVAAASAALIAARNTGKAILCATPHFGGVEFIVPSLAAGSFAVTAALRFTTEQLSESAHAHARAFAASGLFAPITFIEVGKPGTHAALDMAAVLRRKGILVSVFDEKTDYSVAVRLFGARVMGGAGLDRLVAFCGAQTAVFAAFMTRVDDTRYRLDLESVDGSGTAVVQAMYAHLESHVRHNPEQWYFLHEEIPFCK
jgi:lauroyl/myristoyl acyltransferase